MPTIEEQLRNHIARTILFSSSGYPYPDEASFLDKGIIDSLNVMDLVFFVEEQFGLSVADREIVQDNFDSIGKLAAYVRGKQSAP